MGTKLINNDSEKQQAVAVATGIVAIARLIGGHEPGTLDEFLNECENLSEKYVDRLMEAEKETE